ncbi:hypothetical protein Riv7116_1483 [Rivularia sp. PCC 7116]|uniref:hypothetical protein n=1 Tax=Rivularia sp. PCC 7116 TaxID=373994 RepID=UPI00029F2714|nr:hypothetical protein [Rivularia sp. PCC 7116]AFY54044.1 hypothetical protein Riv7116_1483 [Rivularia sp. PCC 7116]
MFKKVVLPTLAISGTIFVGFAALLAQYGSERVEVRVDSQDLFYGEVRDLLSPGVGAALSLTLGVASIAVIGYSKSASREQELEKQLLSLRKAVLDKEVQIEDIKKHEKIKTTNCVDFINYRNFSRR